MSAEQYLELSETRGDVPERENMPRNLEINISSNRGNETLRNENVPETIPPIEQEHSLASYFAWSMLIIIWLGSHAALLLFTVSDNELNEALKIWAIIVCTLETILISGTIVFRNFVRILMVVYMLEFIITLFLEAEYISNTLSSDLLLILSISKALLSYLILRCRI